MHTKTSFNAFFTSWQRCVTNESINENFYEKTGLPIITAIFYLLITIFIMLASFYFAIETWSVWLLLVESILLLIYTLKIKKRTPNALEAYISIINLKCPFNPSIVHTKTDTHPLPSQRIHLLS